LAARAPAGDFAVGRVLERTSAVLSRNFPTFFAVTAIASLPKYLLSQGAIPAPDDWVMALLLISFGVFLRVVLATMSQAIVLYGAFQDMRGRSFGIGQSVADRLASIFSRHRRCDRRDAARVARVPGICGAGLHALHAVVRCDAGLRG
jgi:hypothetical protein